MGRERVPKSWQVVEVEMPAAGSAGVHLLSWCASLE